MIFDIQLAQAAELTPQQQAGLHRLNEECFSDVPQQAVEEDFIAEPFAYLFAVDKDEIISRVALFKREIQFAGQQITLGGMGGVCVTKLHRHHGVASSMLKRGLLILKDEQCDIGCLNVDLDKKIYGIYTKLGFTMMEREISFENVNGETVRDKGTMFIPLCSQEKYNLVMQSKETFHYGRGYW